MVKAQASRSGNCRKVPATVSTILFLRFVIRVTPALPGNLLDFVLLAGKFDPDPILCQPRYARHAAVDPPVVWIVAQKHDLGASLQQQLLIGWMGALAELSRNLRRIRPPLARESVEIGHIDAAGRCIRRSENDVRLAFDQRTNWEHPLIQNRQVLLARFAFADIVEDIE